MQEQEYYNKIKNIVENFEVRAKVQNMEMVLLKNFNEWKIKIGVDNKIIDTYTIYSMETARDMALKITKIAVSDIRVGITGRLSGEIENVDLAIYDRNKKEYYESHIEIEHDIRHNEKLQVIDAFINLFNSTINK